MIHSRFFRILAAAVILALLMLAVPFTPAMAAEALILSPPSGPPGTAITVTGTDFTPSSSGVVWFDTNGNSTLDTGEPQVGATVNTLGNLTGVSTLPVPTAPRAIYQVRADVPSGTPVETNLSFTITPQVTANVSTANVGDSITVSGTGYAATVSVTIYFDGVSKGTTTTNASGSFTGFSFTVPVTTEGTYTIKAEETIAPTNFDTVSLEIDPDIALNPTTGGVGDTVTLTGDGFDASSTVTITFDGTAVVTSPSTVTSNTSGTLPSVTFTVPEASRGSHTVRAQDAGGNYDTATFTVGQKITIDPTSGPSGTTVTVTGRGFAASSTITITYDGETVTTDPATVTTNTAGYFTAEFDVPAGEAGTYVVQASDASTNAATANFEATTSATISQTTSETAPGNVGMSLTITGVGFTPESTVTVTYATDPVTLATAPTGPTGNFSVTFTIPASAGGEHTITVSDGTISREFDFFMEESPPPAPELVAPAEGEKADAEAIFDWSTVQDASPASNPVTYDLQVATSESFSVVSLLINETGLEESTYTVLPADELESTGDDAPYHWRVRAVDAASNESAWSEVGTFTVGWSFEFSGWIVYVTMVVIAAAFFFLGLWIGRRGGGGEYY